jgi:hypothetical protein
MMNHTTAQYMLSSVAQSLAFRYLLHFPERFPGLQPCYDGGKMQAMKNDNMEQFTNYMFLDSSSKS